MVGRHSLERAAEAQQLAVETRAVRCLSPHRFGLLTCILRLSAGFTECTMLWLLRAKRGLRESEPSVAFLTGNGVDWCVRYSYRGERPGRFGSCP